MMRSLLISLIFVFGTLSAGAQDAPVIASAATASLQRILVIGDSIAGGLAAGMVRVAAGDDTIQIVSRFNESSAIARPDVYDWAAAIPKIMEGKEFTGVVVLIGLNDRQDIRTANGRLTFNTPQWTAAYQANADAIVDALKAQNVKVFWLSEQPMGDPAYDADMKLVSALQKDRVVAKGGIYIDTRPELSNPDGSFMDFGPDETGAVKKLRQRDGVTFLKQGNNKFGQIILAAVKAGGQGPVPVPVVVSPVVLSPAEGPVFGQEGTNGAPVLHDAETVVTATSNVVQVPVGADSQKPASLAAEKLFSTGEASVAPAGRFDDFSYVAPAQ